MSASTDPKSRTTNTQVPSPRTDTERTVVSPIDAEVPASRLFRLNDLEEIGTTSELTDRELTALHAVADWIRTYVVRPHENLGRDGPVCPFVPGALERGTLWLAPERIADRGVEQVAELMTGYKQRFLHTPPADGESSSYKVIVVVFTDVPADRAHQVFDDVLREIAVQSYLDDGIVFGPFYEGNTGTAIYNADFHPFQSPVPFLFVRHGVADDWKFFLDQPDWFHYWAHRFGEAAADALAAELRPLPLRARRS